MGGALIAQLQSGSDTIAALYEGREFSKAIREIMTLADRVNEYVERHKPWELAKVEGGDAELQQVCSVCIEAFRLLTLYLKPVMPRVASDVENFLQIAPLTWAHVNDLLGPHTIAAYRHLIQRVDPKVLEVLFEGPANADPAPSLPESTATAAVSTVPERASTRAHAGRSPGGEPIAPEIGIDDFSKIDLRVALIVNCEHVEGADKLLRLTLDAGEGRHRTVFSGIKSAYQPADLIGRHTVLIANLAPRKMKFGLSEGMVLAASDADRAVDAGIYLLNPDSGAVPGMRIR